MAAEGGGALSLQPLLPSLPLSETHSTSLEQKSLLITMEGFSLCAEQGLKVQRCVWFLLSSSSQKFPDLFSFLQTDLCSFTDLCTSLSLHRFYLRCNPPT